ncbi:hypothetical protein FWK35_00003470 [Aphis craccivora]|uniref:Uncharacterized protein n=1 Tax=Aphis craccivora TaxID=307492 RepID=A0A6G0ZQM6_APHCR|nr:hypothetical protein FWK35_00003470 [Aphis craccivora]
MPNATIMEIATYEKKSVRSGQCVYRQLTLREAADNSSVVGANASIVRLVITYNNKRCVYGRAEKLCNILFSKPSQYA